MVEVLHICSIFSFYW